MSIYYLKETRCYNDKPRTIDVSLFLLDFDKNTYQWLITRNFKPMDSTETFDNMFDNLLHHTQYIAHQAKTNRMISCDFDILTKGKAEELMFLLGI